MLLRQRKAETRLGGVASRTLALGCAAFLLAFRAFAAPAAPANLLATPGNAKVTVTLERCHRRDQLQRLPQPHPGRLLRLPARHRPDRHLLHG